MFKSAGYLAAMVFSLGHLQPAAAGYYSTIDAEEETQRLSRDYVVFRAVIDRLKTIRNPRPATNPIIRRRYILIETMGRDGIPKLDTLEEKLNYSAVLIRRGRALEAARFLAEVYAEDRKNFLILSQYATAHFLSGDPALELQSALFMRKALDNWPKTWGEVKGEQKKFLESLGWEETAFDRYRRYETFFKRLIDNRLKEKKRFDPKNPPADTLDPIFVDAKGEPIRFVNEKGAFEVGHIAAADKEQLPRDAVEAVEQLLLWMPGDNRLLWLLGEVFNASAMEHRDRKDKNQAIVNAFTIFQKMTNPLDPTNYGLKEINSRYDALSKYVDAMPPEDLKLPDDDTKEVPMSSRQWWRVTAVGFITGLLIGLFALWQVQEMRRRRQARAA
jgi:hypothetical protein